MEIARLRAVAVDLVPALMPTGRPKFGRRAARLRLSSTKKRGAMMTRHIAEDNYPALFGLLAAVVERARHDLQAPDASDVQKIEAQEFLDWLTSSEVLPPFATGGDDRRARSVIVNRKIRAV